MISFFSLLRKEGLAFGILAAVLALVITPALLAPSYTVKQGAYAATIKQLNSGASMTGRPVLKAMVEDAEDRRFWITLPSTEPLSNGDRVEIGVLCETEAFERCTAMYLASLKDGTVDLQV